MPLKLPFLIGYSDEGTNDRLSGWTSPGDVGRRAIEARRVVATLTPRQRQVLLGILQGASNKQIAHDLGVGLRTIEAHRSILMHRLNAKVTADAVRIGIYAGVDMGAD